MYIKTLNKPIEECLVELASFKLVSLLDNLLRMSVEIEFLHPNNNIKYILLVHIIILYSF